MKIQALLLLFFLTVLTLSGETAGAIAHACQGAQSPIVVAREAIKASKKVDPSEAPYSQKPVSVQEFTRMVDELTAEKLLWFSIEQFANEQIKIWPEGAEVKNFLSYTVDVFVKNSNGDLIRVYLPLVSFGDTRSGGYVHHIHIRHALLESFGTEVTGFVDKGAVIIEKHGNDFLVEDMDAYPHVTIHGERMVVAANRSNSIVYKKSQ